MKESVLVKVTERFLKRCMDISFDAISCQVIEVAKSAINFGLGDTFAASYGAFTAKFYL